MLLAEWWILSDGAEIEDPHELSRAALNGRCQGPSDDDNGCCCCQARRESLEDSAQLRSATFWHSTGLEIWNASTVRSGCEVCCKVMALRCFLLASRLFTLSCPAYTHVLHDATVAGVLLCEKGRRQEHEQSSNQSWLDPSVAKALLAAKLTLRWGVLAPMASPDTSAQLSTHARAGATHTALLNAASVLALSQRPKPALQALRLFLWRDCSVHGVHWRCLQVLRRLWFGGCVVGPSSSSLLPCQARRLAVLLSCVPALCKRAATGS